MNQDADSFDGASANDIKTPEHLDGHIIRFDDTGESAFIFIENGDMSEYRWVACQELGALGPLQEGQAFVLLQETTNSDEPVFRFSPAAPKSLLSEEELAERNKRARERIKPLDDLKVDIY
jgi:hypothetical protein